MLRCWLLWNELIEDSIRAEFLLECILLTYGVWQFVARSRLDIVLYRRRPQSCASATQGRCIDYRHGESELRLFIRSRSFLFEILYHWHLHLLLLSELILLLPVLTFPTIASQVLIRVQSRAIILRDVNLLSPNLTLRCECFS